MDTIVEKFNRLKKYLILDKNAYQIRDEIKEIIKNAPSAEQKKYNDEYKSILQLLDIKHQIDYINRLDGTDRLRLYTNNEFYKKFNAKIRNDSVLNSEQLSVKDFINTAFAKSPPTTNQLILWRGVNSLSVHDIVFGKGVLSCSLLRSVATGFSGKDCCLLKIVVPYGCKILPVFTISEFDSELEVLIDSVNIFTYTGVEKDDGKDVYTFHVTPPGTLVNEKTLKTVIRESQEFDKAEYKRQETKVDDSTLQKIQERLEQYLKEQQEEDEDFFDREFEIDQYLERIEGMSETDKKKIRVLLG
jgi:hypothetical protein